MLTTGQLLADRYRLSRRIAVGGMGEVWEAADDRLDRRVAVKVLKAELSGDPEFLHRFRTEARMTASLNHPGIASVHDYGETASIADGPEDTAYLVMELVEGEPLATIISRGRLSADVTLDLLEQTGNALQAAHERGLVHRDVKPGNIMVTPSGKVKITDFGIAKAVDAAPVTRSGMVMGTAHYIAPEQALGGEAEPASDVYSLAVCGYECLAGRRPFLSDNAVTVAMMHIRDMAPPLPPDVPPGARALIEATLVKDPRQRYRTGGEFAAAVSAVRVGQPLPTPSGFSMPQVPQQAPPPPQVSQPLPIPPQMAHHPTPARPGTHPTMQPAHQTGAFTPMPVPPGRNRTVIWVMVAFLVTVLLVLGVVVLWKFTVGANDGNGQGGLPTTSGSVNTNPPANGQAKPDSADRIPGNAPKLLDEDDYIGRSGDEVRIDLVDRGLEPRVQSPQGTSPGDLKKCRVTAIEPTGEVPAGSQVKVTCAP